MPNKDLDHWTNEMGGLGGGSMRLIKWVICLFRGHRLKIIISHTGYNWECKRCGIIRPIDPKGSLFED